MATAEGIKEATEAPGAEDTGEGTADREGRRAAATAEAGTGTRATTTATGGTAVLTTGGGGRALARAGAGRRPVAVPGPPARRPRDRDRDRDRSGGRRSSPRLRCSDGRSARRRVESAGRGEEPLVRASPRSRRD